MKNARVGLDELVDRYAKRLSEHARFLAEGDYRRGNPIADQIRKDIFLIANYGTAGAEKLMPLLGSDDIGIRLGAATDLLGYSEEIAVEKLKELAVSDSVPPLLGFTAEQTLEAWFRGELTSKFWRRTEIARRVSLGAEKVAGGTL